MQNVPVVLLLCISPPSDPSNWHVVQEVDAAAMQFTFHSSIPPIMAYCDFPRPPPNLLSW